MSRSRQKKRSRRRSGPLIHITASAASHSHRSFDRSVIDLQDLVLGSSEVIVEGGDRRMGVAQAADGLEQHRLGVAELGLVVNVEGADHADRAALAHRVLAPTLFHLLPGFHQHLGDGRGRHVLAAIERHWFGSFRSCAFRAPTPERWRCCLQREGSTACRQKATISRAYRCGDAEISTEPARSSGGRTWLNMASSARSYALLNRPASSSGQAKPDSMTSPPEISGPMPEARLRGTEVRLAAAARSRGVTTAMT